MTIDNENLKQRIINLLADYSSPLDSQTIAHRLQQSSDSSMRNLRWQQVDALLQEALENDEVGQDEFLDWFIYSTDTEQPPDAQPVVATPEPPVDPQPAPADPVLQTQQPIRAFEANDTEEGLEHIRQRLLDLTLRNRLLNFRHTKRSSLRVIDEIPNQLYCALTKGRKLTFIPLPEPTRPELIRYYQDQNVPWRNQKPSEEEWATHKGIPTGFDLMPSDGDNEPQHSDTKIQTLQYPKDLEVTLKKIASVARTAIEESGTNMLYLGIGFLEWQESEQAASKPLAPLILLPVTIEQGPVSRQTDTRTYKLSYSEEDITTNISLKEKLDQDFGLNLPEIGEEELPEAYFIRVAEEIQGKPEWCLRRYVTLSLFQFGKLLMYLDLNPLKWPGQNILDHPIVRSFFEGARSDGPDHVTDYNIDEQPELVNNIPLIREADSSQHSAIIDALQGRNLVIEGPPGTGKSQTITNLIAAALHQGKTVLFVSEKLAALEVVHRRLRDAALGDFCLELHSHKAQKKTLLSDIKRRLESRGSYRSPREIHNKIEMLERDKAHLKEHAELMALEFGRLGLTIHEILCAAARYRLVMSPHITALGDGPFSDSDQVTPIDISESEGALTTYQAAYEEIIQQWQTTTAHPWHGVCNIDLQPFDRAGVEERLTAWKNAGEKLVIELIAFEERTEATLETAGCHPQTFSRLTQAIPSPAPEAWTHLLPQLSTAEPVDHLAQFVEALVLFQQNGQRANQTFQDYRLVRGDLRTRFKRILDDILTRVKVQVSVHQLVELRERLDHQLTGLVEAVTPVLNDLTHHLATPLSLQEESIQQIRTAIQICNKAPNALLHMRSDLFDNDELDRVLQSAEAEMLTLNKQATALQDTYNISALPEAQTLRQAQQTMATGGFFRWLKADWRQANTLLKSLALSSMKGTPEIKAQVLASLAQYKEHKEAIEQNEQAHRLLGPLFQGVETQLADLRSLREWYTAVRNGFGPGLGARGISSDALLRLSDALIRDIAQLEQDAFSSNIDAIHSLRTQLKSSIPALEQGPIDGADSILPDLIHTLNQGLDIFGQAGVRTEKNLHQLRQTPAQLQQLDDLESNINDNAIAQSILGDAFEGVSTSVTQAAATLSIAQAVHEAELPTDVKHYLIAQGSTASFQSLQADVTHLTSLLTEVDQRRSTFAEYTQLDLSIWFGTSPAEVDIDQVIQRADTALADPVSLAQWTTYMRAKRQLEPRHLLSLARLVEEGTLASDEIIPAFRCTTFNDMARSILQQHPTLRDFNRHNHNTVRDRFRQFDEDIIVLQQQEIASRVDHREVPRGIDHGRASSRTELALLEHETNLQRHRISIRQLMRRSGKALQALKPCFMMGPLSVAQYLQPGELIFDLIIMDEASQVRPEDALGTIARGEQVVIVGDPRQLPPTRFFDRMFGDDEVDEDLTVLEDAESILDASINIFKPARRLLWHYRSRHEKLIAFSNHYFYDDNPLIVFPSPDPENPRFGVRFAPILNGVFRNSHNVPEAKRIAEAVIQHMRDHRDESLGVVAMNNQQSELIADEVDTLLKQDPRAQNYVETYNENSEPFFVKNLENVQGDERDVIFISFTYGPASEGGQVFQRFGPINSQVGWRRLNVLFTRAKNRVVAFSSMSSSDIRGGPDVSAGTRALKNYLAYAETGILEQAIETGRPPDSDFEVSVAQALQHAGYECEAQVGMAGFFIDLAVRHPDFPGRYLLGIECDGATYHSARSVRDRDRLRQAILENLGWTIHRIWSTDWFRDPESEIQRVIYKLNDLREEVRQQTYIAEEFAAPPPPSDEGPTTGETGAEQLDIEFQEESLDDVDDRFITAEQARDMLIDIRENKIKIAFPDSDPTEGFLRKSMLDALLQYRPKNSDEFRLKIRLDLREKMNTQQFAQFHEEVFAILNQIIDPTSRDMFGR